MKKSGAVKIVIISIIFVGLILGYYIYLSNKQPKVEENVTVSAVQEILLKDISIAYPPSPKEVVKYYCEITKCFYNEEYTDEELVQLAKKIQEVYDDELIANQTWDNYYQSLKGEIATMKNNGTVISSYATSSAADVEYYSVDGFDFAKLYCVFNLRQGTQMVSTNEVFLLRKDTQGHWKIYGWKLADDENE